jgi:beta-mannanase
MIPNVLIRCAVIGVMLMSMSSAELKQIGAWVGGDGTYPQPTKSNVEAFQTMQCRHVDLISLFAVWDVNTWAWTKTYADIAAENNSILVVTWMANGYTTQQIINGSADSYLKAYAEGVKSYGKEIWLRPFHEANGDWYDWGIAKSGAGNTNETLIGAWKHVATIFRNLEVKNVKWVWSTNATNSGSATFTGWFPGDDWVDMVSIDGYNWGTAQSWSSWQGFSQVMTPAYNALSSSSKPLFISEFSCSEQGGNKAQWITNMFNDIPSKFPRIFALMWFSQSKSAEADWAVNTSEAALNAWKAGILKITTVKRAEHMRPVVYHNPSKNKNVITFGRLSSNNNKSIFDFQGRKIDNMKMQKHYSGVFIERSLMKTK